MAKTKTKKTVEEEVIDVKFTPINRVPKFPLGTMVVVKSYPTENPITGDPLSLPPIMVVCGIEIENRKKKTHDNAHGKQIAEFIKYKLVWFDAKNSNFIEKIMYESFLVKFKSDEKVKLIDIDYDYSGISIFKSYPYEIRKEKKSKSIRETKDGKTDTILKITTTLPIVPFASPDFVMTGMKINEEKEKFDDKGNPILVVPKRLIKIMWYNAQQQKYSEYEIAENCLIKKI